MSRRSRLPAPAARRTVALQSVPRESVAPRGSACTAVPSRRRKVRPRSAKFLTQLIDTAKVALLESEEEQLNNVQRGFPFQVVLDTGAADHVADNIDAPRYEVTPRAGSMAGAAFSIQSCQGSPHPEW